MGEWVHLEVDDGVGTIRLDRPPANAIDERVGLELGVAAAEAGRRDDVRAVVVWGGRKLYAAGADIKTMAPLDPEGIRPVVSALGDALLVLEQLPVVTIAAVNGYALGGGCEIALACDLRLAADDAVFGQPEVSIGVLPGAGGTQRLPRVVGFARAIELLLSGRQVDAAEAERIGLVHEIYPADDVYTRAIERARVFSRGPGLAHAAIKSAMSATGTFDERLEQEREAFIALFGSQDQREGMAAFLEKRAPSFRGR